MELNIEAFVSALGGCGMATACASYTIGRALADVRRLGDKVQTISESLSAISVRLEKIVEHDTTLKEHAKKIAYFEGEGVTRAQRVVQ